MGALECSTEGRDESPRSTGEWITGDDVGAYRSSDANETRHLFRWSTDREVAPWILEYAVDDDG